MKKYLNPRTDPIQAHAPIHTDLYFEKLLDRMKKAKIAGKDLRDELQRVAVDISNKTF